MKPLILLAAFGVASIACSQDTETGSSAGTTSTIRMSNVAIAKLASALKAGKKVMLTVDSRSVAYTPRLIGSMVFVPVRFFNETGQDVAWDGTDMRATLRDPNGKQKNSIEYDAMRGQANFKPGKTMRPFYEKGRLWVPLASGLGAFDLLAEWVPTSSRLNVKTNRARG